MGLHKCTIILLLRLCMWMTLLTVFENCPKNLNVEHFDKIRLFGDFQPLCMNLISQRR